MDNLEIYNKVRNVPKEAQKTIGAGRLKGMTDINPQWRIKILTEQFGACGFGWYIKPIKEWLEVGANNEITTNVMIELYVKLGDEWSKGIVGIGGSKFITKESNGLYTSDESYKMAYTDAISVACKMLGIGADVYWDKDRTKYSDGSVEKQKTNKIKKDEQIPVRTAKETLKSIIIQNPFEANIIKDIIDTEYGGKPSKELTEDEAKEILNKLSNNPEEQINE